ncbi:MAG: VWA domain-containing protein [Deltaproteobacteria bacterium]|nr:VWA domain-containing protein [Deltaproteobacteria bacterium]
MFGRTRALVALAILAALAGAPGTASADGFIVVTQPGVVPPGHPPFAPLEIQSHHVKVAIRDQVAITEVEQVFRNPGEQRLEGDYFFPIPVAAAVDRFTMEIDGREQKAELVDAAEARRIYEDIVRRMRDPALLEYGERGAFRVHVFPIEPHSTKRIRLAYTQVLRRDGGTVDYEYPLDTEKLSAAPIDSVSVTVHVESKTPLKAIWSPTHAVEVKRSGELEALVGFEQSHARPDTAFRLFYDLDASAAVGLSVLTYRESATDEGYFALLASPCAASPAGQEIPKDVVFAVDTSGSMKGAKLDQLRRALRQAIGTLRSRDRFQVVRFSTEAEPLFPGLVEASDANRARALAFVDAFEAAGGTAIGEALSRALAPIEARGAEAVSRPSIVAFVTDGLPTVGQTDALELVAAARARVGERGTRIFAFGVGEDVDTRLLDGLAEATRGVAQYVGAQRDIEREVASFAARIGRPALTGLALGVDGGEVRFSKVQPRALPDLFHGDQLVVLGRFAGSGKARVKLTGSAAGTARVVEQVVDFPAAAATGAPFLPKLWATRRVGFLLQEIRRGGESAELRDEVTALARRHGLVTPYTSYLVLEDERRKDVPAPLATVAPPPASSGSPQADFNVFRNAPSGAAAVAGSKVAGAMRDAGSLDELGVRQREVRRELAAQPSDDHGAEALGQSLRWAEEQGQRQRTVGRKTFYRNGTRWIDAELSEHGADPRERIVFGSPEYFAIAREHRELGAWLALGREVLVRVDGRTLEIVDESR